MKGLTTHLVVGIIAAIALYYGVQIFVVPEIQELTSALQNIRVH
jgi:hypothetical protein